MILLPMLDEDWRDDVPQSMQKQTKTNEQKKKISKHNKIITYKCMNGIRSVGMITKLSHHLNTDTVLQLKHKERGTKQ